MMSYRAGNKDFQKLEDNVDYTKESGMVVIKGSPKWPSPFDIKSFHPSLIQCPVLKPRNTLKRRLFLIQKQSLEYLSQLINT